MNNKAILDQLVCVSVRELFAEYGIFVHEVLAPIDPHDFVAIIGFAGESMRGVLGIGLDRDVVVKMFAGGRHDRGLAEDWIGEAANQLLGRVKNKLAPYGITLGIAVPMTLRGLEVNLVRSAEVSAYRFMTSEGGITVWFDARLPPSVILQHRLAAEPRASREGDLTLF